MAWLAASLTVMCWPSAETVSVKPVGRTMVVASIVTVPPSAPGLAPVASGKWAPLVNATLPPVRSDPAEHQPEGGPGPVEQEDLDPVGGGQAGVGPVGDAEPIGQWGRGRAVGPGVAAGDGDQARAAGRIADGSGPGDVRIISRQG